MSQRYIWRVLCPATNQYETTISDTEPTVCPSDGVTPLDPAFTTIMEAEFYEVVSPGYVNIESQLADNQALKIIASDTNGGIDIDAGLGGITLDSTNTISLDAAAASNFTTTVGNLTLTAVAGLVDIDAGSGVNVGNGSANIPINIGTTGNSKIINIGNAAGTTAVTLSSGSGKVTISSAATGTNAIDLFSSGGIEVNSTAVLRLASADATVSALTLDASFNNGGIVLSSGTQGIILTSNGGPIALGSWSGGDVYLGTGGVSRVISMGNTTGTTAVVITSGTGGITIGNDSGGGEVQIANVASAKRVVVGNNTGASSLFTRHGTNGLIKTQLAPVSLADSDVTLTIAELLTGLLTITPTVTRTLTLPTAANAVAGISGVQVDDAIEFTVIHLTTPTNVRVVVAPGTNGTLVGNSDILGQSNPGGTILASGSGTYRLRFTNVSGGTEAYTVYRIT